MCLASVCALRNAGRWLKLDRDVGDNEGGGENPHQVLVVARISPFFEACSNCNHTRIYDLRHGMILYPNRKRSVASGKTECIKRVTFSIKPARS